MRNWSETGEPCQFLEWDSQFFGFRVASVLRPSLDAVSMEQALAWCAENRIDCLYYLSEASDAAALKLAHERGFRFVDVRMTLRRPVEPSRPVPPAPPGTVFRRAEPRDVPDLRKVAARSHMLSRFWTDEHFDRAACAELYARWFERSCQGYADSAWVAENGGRAVGYMTCHLRPESLGEFGLAGIDVEARGLGLGRGLFERGIAWLRDEGCTQLRVVTQGSNVAAQRLYQFMGFRTSQVEYWHHLWFSSGKAPRA